MFSAVINTLVLPACLIDRHHPGDDQRDAGVNREEDAGRYSGTAETGRGGQPAGLSGSHTGKTLCALCFLHQSQFKACLISSLFALFLTIKNVRYYISIPSEPEGKKHTKQTTQNILSV